MARKSPRGNKDHPRVALRGEFPRRPLTKARSRAAHLFAVVKLPNVDVVTAFSMRLREVAGFEYVSEPLPMRNSVNAVVYYLLFAAHQPVAAKIVSEIVDTYRNRLG